MSRTVWFVAGASVGVYAMNKARVFAGSLSAEGMRSRWIGLTHGARLLAQDAKQAQVEREDELRAQMGLPAIAPLAERQLSPARSAPGATPELFSPAQNDPKDTL